MLRMGPMAQSLPPGPAAVLDRHWFARQTSAELAITCPRLLRQTIRFMGCRKSMRKLPQIRQNCRFPGMIFSSLRSRDPLAPLLRDPGDAAKAHSPPQGAARRGPSATAVPANAASRAWWSIAGSLAALHETFRTTLGFLRADPRPADWPSGFQTAPRVKILWLYTVRGKKHRDLGGWKLPGVWGKGIFKIICFAAKQMVKLPLKCLPWLPSSFALIFQTHRHVETLKFED